MLSTIVLFSLLAQGPGAGLQGADKVIATLKAQAAKPVKPAPSLRPHIEAYNSKSGSMTVAQAADGWMRLLGAWEKNGAGPDEQGNNDQSPRIMIEALPRPEVWPAIRSRLAKRPSSLRNDVLVTLFDLLMGKDAVVIQSLERLKKPTEDGMDIEGDGILKIQLPLALRTGNVAVASGVLAKGSRSQSFFFFDGIPDIVGKLGPQKARPVLARMLESAVESYDKFNGAATHSMAREILFANLGKIKVAQWSLVETTDDAVKLVARYGFVNMSRGGAKAARLYLAHLLSTSKIDDAVKMLKSDEAGYHQTLTDPKLFDPISHVLDKDPDCGVWEDYVSIAKQLGRLPEVSARLDSLLARTNLKPEARRRFLEQKGDLQANAGDADGAIRTYIQGAKILRGERSWDQINNKLLRLADATGNREAIDVAIEATSDSDYETAFDELVRQGRLADAQSDLLRRLATPSRYGNNGPEPATPANFAELYYRANRPADVVELLDTYPFWRDNDLFNVLTLRDNPNYSARYQGMPFGFYAAWAFSKTGRKPLAIKTLHRLLAFELDLDEPYELLNELEGKDALPLYLQLQRTDPFATRPLMWKADLLLRLGMLKEAEETARAAISLDPTDGNARAGNRLMAYTILARILRASGKTSEAETYERIVQAVRIAEKGDLFREAGLVPQAKALYDEANKTFADAYCVQARLALTLIEQGDFAGAIDHYRRAYELMPASFGQIEAYCFGCEGAFDRPEMIQVGQTVFEKLAAEQPSNPKVKYLLGRLFVAANEPEKAMGVFKEAVRLDPRYYNAWEQILDLDVGTEAQMREAALAILRLDPMSLHGGWRAKRYVDYTTLWRLYDNARKSLPSPPKGPLYPLTKAPEEPRDMMGRGFRLPSLTGPGASPVRVSPGAEMVSDELIQGLCSIYVFAN